MQESSARSDSFPEPKPLIDGTSLDSLPSPKPSSDASSGGAGGGSIQSETSSEHSNHTLTGDRPEPPAPVTTSPGTMRAPSMSATSSAMTEQVNTPLLVCGESSGSACSWLHTPVCNSV